MPVEKRTGNLLKALVYQGKSIIVGYLMPNLLYTYKLNIYDLVYKSFISYQRFILFNATSFLYIYEIYDKYF